MEYYYNALFCTLFGIILHVQFSWMLEIPTVIPRDLYRFSDEGKKIYARHLHNDPLEPTKLYVGAMEHIYVLNTGRIDDGQYQKSVALPSSQIASYICGQAVTGGDRDLVCKNHVRTIMLDDHDHNNNTSPRIYVCGTGARQPIEEYLDRSTLQRIQNTEGKAQSKCPYHPDHSYTCLNAMSGNPGNLPSLYSGTIKLSRSQTAEPVIYRPPIKHQGQELYDLLQTQSPALNENWLLDAVFVGSFERGKHVYFFFHERVTEYKGCLEQRFTRVARICKNDEGGKNSRQTQWTSFFKATLECSIPGPSPFRFNKITDVTKTRTGFIASFIADGNTEFSGSAICQYSFSALDKVFDEGLFMKEDKNGQWYEVNSGDVPVRRPGSCVPNSAGMTDEEFNFINEHQLMSDTVKPDYIDNLPLFFKSGVIFEHFIIDTSTSYNVYFLASNKGEIYKVVWLPSSKKSTILSIYKPFRQDTKIWSMLKYSDSIYLGTDDGVVQLRMSQCNSYENCNQCAQDPYCGWNPSTSTCQQFISNQVHAQDVSATRVLEVCSDSDACDKVGYREERVRVPGSSVYFPCQSHCVAEEPIKWLRYEEEVDLAIQLPNGNPRYIMGQDNSLVIMNVTSIDSGIYYCRSGRFEFAQYGLRFEECGNDEKCHWEKEFRNWCDEFDKYQKEFNNWVCVKNECTNNEENCLPGAQETCSRKSP